MKVSVILGSEKDKSIGDSICKVLREFNVEVEYLVISAHKSPEKLREYVKSSDSEVFVGVAGLSAALPGVIASYTVKPVIGVPRSVKFGGLDSLLSIVQMPPGTPVACVGVDSGENAALLAVEILSLKYPELQEKLKSYRRVLAEKYFEKLSVD